MATTYLNLVGKARFIKHIYTPDEAFGASRFKAGIYLDDVNKEKFEKSGIQVSIKTDENGEYVILSRDDAKLIKKILVYFTPPYIKNKDMTYRVSYVNENDEIVRQYQDAKDKEKIRRIGEPFLIGNGSLVELNVCVFDTQTRGKGHRLEGIRILDLIEYKPQERSEQAQESVASEPAVVEEVTEKNTMVMQSQPIVANGPKPTKKAPF